MVKKGIKREIYDAIFQFSWKNFQKNWNHSSFYGIKAQRNNSLGKRYNYKQINKEVTLLEAFIFIDSQYQDTTG
jgi:hypothetical protein